MQLSLLNYLRQRRARPFDLAQDFLAFRAPTIRLGAQVPLGKVRLDGLNQFPNALKTPLAHHVRRQVGEEPLDQVHPRTPGGSEVHVKPRAPGQPRLHRRLLVRRVVVGDQMQGKIPGRLALDLLEKPQPFHVRMPLFRTRDDLSIEVAKRRKQRDGAVARVVVRARANVSQPQRQSRLSAFERLALALLVATEHQRLVGRVQVEADDVPELALEIGVLGNLERAREVRTDVVVFPYLMHRVARDSNGFGHRTHTPAHAARRGFLQRLGDHRFELARADTRFSSAPRLVSQSIQPIFQKAAGPFRDADLARAQAFRDFFLLQAIRSQQNDLGTLAVALGCARGAYAALEFGALGFG